MPYQNEPEYIEKINGKFYARKGDDKEINETIVFASRVNCYGVSGYHVMVDIDEWSIEWLSNFGYQKLSFGAAYINFRGIFLLAHYDINTTQDFVEVLNYYENITSQQKDDILVKIANKLAHYRKKLGKTKLNSFGNNPMFLAPTVPFEELPQDIDKYAIKDI